MHYDVTRVTISWWGILSYFDYSERYQIPYFLSSLSKCLYQDSSYTFKVASKVVGMVCMKLWVSFAVFVFNQFNLWLVPPIARVFDKEVQVLFTIWFIYLFSFCLWFIYIQIRYFLAMWTLGTLALDVSPLNLEWLHWPTLAVARSMWMLAPSYSAVLILLFHNLVRFWNV